MEQAALIGDDEARELARRAYDEFDRARDFRAIRNQHPMAKSAHAKGMRLLRKASARLAGVTPSPAVKKRSKAIGASSSSDQDS